MNVNEGTAAGYGHGCAVMPITMSVNQPFISWGFWWKLSRNANDFGHNLQPYVMVNTRGNEIDFARESAQREWLVPSETFAVTCYVGESCT